jgi:hypothetical protein
MAKRFESIEIDGQKYILDIQELTLTKEGRKKPTCVFVSHEELAMFLDLPPAPVPLKELMERTETEMEKRRKYREYVIRNRKRSGK